MIEALLFFMLAYHIEDMEIGFWLWLSFFVLVKLVRFVILAFTDK